MTGDRTLRRVDRIFEDAGVKRDLVVETQYAITHCNLVTLGVGCSIVNPATAIGFVSQGLVILPFRPRIEFEYLLYTPSFRALSQTALRFIEIMTEVRDEMVAAGTFGEPPAPARFPLCRPASRSEEHTSELQSLMRISYAVF